MALLVGWRASGACLVLSTVLGAVGIPRGHTGEVACDWDGRVLPGAWGEEPYEEAKSGHGGTATLDTGVLVLGRSHAKDGFKQSLGEGEGITGLSAGECFESRGKQVPGSWGGYGLAHLREVGGAPPVDSATSVLGVFVTSHLEVGVIVKTKYWVKLTLRVFWDQKNEKKSSVRKIIPVFLVIRRKCCFMQQTDTMKKVSPPGGCASPCNLGRERRAMDWDIPFPPGFFISVLGALVWPFLNLLNPLRLRIFLSWFGFV